MSSDHHEALDEEDDDFANRLTQDVPVSPGARAQYEAHYEEMPVPKRR